MAAMFDSRNKAQPKLVYASQQDPNRNDRARALSKSDACTNRQNEDKQLSSQQAKGQKNMNQQQHKDIQPPTETQEQQRQISVGVSSKKSESNTEVQNEIPASTQSGNKVIGEAHKPNPQQRIVMESNTKNEEFEGYRIYRGRDNENSSEILSGIERLQKSSESIIVSANVDNKINVSPTASGHNSSMSSNSQQGYLTYGRHSLKSISSPSIQRRTVTPPRSPNQATRTQHLIYQPQRLHMHRDHPRQNEDRVLRSPVITVRSYSVGRQQASTTLPMILRKSGNLGDIWNIPRVSSPTSERPQTLPLSLGRSQEGTPPSKNNENEFLNYSPSASPRALRPISKFDLENISPHSPPSPPLSSNPPKSILKNTLSLENPDAYLNTHPILLPRAHSERNPNYRAQDFDFSTILTSNKDQVSTTPSDSPTLRSKRPATGGASPTKCESGQDGQPARKSVTFNSLVRLHLDNHVSTVRSLSVDA